MRGDRTQTRAVGEYHPAQTFLHQAGLADYKIPDQIQFIDQLPKTSVGKIDKNALRRRFDTLGLALMS